MSAATAGAHVAFDLDSTLGFFEITNPLSHFWSPEFVGNPEQIAPNEGPLDISPRLAKKLKRARQIFATRLAQNKELLRLVLRPNLDAMFLPLLKARRNKKLATVILYSNTGVTPSTELAKLLIEQRYKAPGLIALAADHWHPLRVADRFPLPKNTYMEPLKTMETLQKLFSAATGRRGPVPFEHILFVDDRFPKHDLQRDEPRGLTYVVPTPFIPRLTKERKKAILMLAMECMDHVGLLRDHEYLESRFCNRFIPYDFTKRHTIRGFPDLFQYVWTEMSGVVGARSWSDDTAYLEREVTEFLRRI